MTDSPSAQTFNERAIINSLDREFARLHSRSRSLIEAMPAEILYLNPLETATGLSPFSVGENILRSAGAVEQTFGGITSNLWDDPFEWTLPETLTTPQSVVEYLEEVEATRQRAFKSFSNDAELLKQIAVPSGANRALISLLLDTLVRATNYEGRALATLRVLSDARTPDLPI
jgi:hypothetical protein